MVEHGFDYGEYGATYGGESGGRWSPEGQPRPWWRIDGRRVSLTGLQATYDSIQVDFRIDSRRINTWRDRYERAGDIEKVVGAGGIFRSFDRTNSGIEVEVRPDEQYTPEPFETRQYLVSDYSDSIAGAATDFEVSMEFTCLENRDLGYTEGSSFESYRETGISAQSVSSVNYTPEEMSTADTDDSMTGSLTGNLTTEFDTENADTEFTAQAEDDTVSISDHEWYFGFFSDHMFIDDHFVQPVTQESDTERNIGVVMFVDSDDAKTIMKSLSRQDALMQRQIPDGDNVTIDTTNNRNVIQAASNEETTLDDGYYICTSWTMSPWKMDKWQFDLEMKTLPERQQLAIEADGFGLAPLGLEPFGY